jgi:hypothetical protein
MLRGGYRGTQGRKAGGTFRGPASPRPLQRPPPRCQAALDDILAKAQSTPRERRVRGMTENEIGGQMVDRAVQIHTWAWSGMAGNARRDHPGPGTATATPQGPPPHGGGLGRWAQFQRGPDEAWHYPERQSPCRARSMIALRAWRLGESNNRPGMPVNSAEEPISLDFFRGGDEPGATSPVCCGHCLILRDLFPR